MRREALQAFVHLPHPSPMDYRRSAYCHKQHGASIAMSFAIITRQQPRYCLRQLNVSMARVVVSMLPKRRGDA